MGGKIGTGPIVHRTILHDLEDYLSSDQYPYPDRLDPICYFDIKELLSFVSFKYDLDRKELDSKVNWGTTIGELADLIMELNPDTEIK